MRQAGGAYACAGAVFKAYSYFGMVICLLYYGQAHQCPAGIAGGQ